MKTKKINLILHSSYLILRICHLMISTPTVSVIFLVNFPGKISNKSLIQHPQPKKLSNNDPFN